jgi:hypothetical protein
VNVFVTQTLIEENWLPSRCLAIDAILFFISTVTVCLEHCYDKYVSKGRIKQIVTLYFVSMRTCFAKLRPADTHVPAFKPHVTMLSVMGLMECKGNVKFPTPSLLKHHAMKTYMEGSHSSTLLDLSTSWRWIISFTPEENTPDPLHRRLNGSQSWCGHCGVQ